MTAHTEAKEESQQLAKAYEFADVEKKWYTAWLEHKTFQAHMDPARDSYSIVIPPLMSQVFSMLAMP